MWSPSRLKGIFAIVSLFGLGVFSAWELWEAATTGVTRGRHRQLIALADEPLRYGFSVAVHGVVTIAIWGLFALLAWGMAQERANGPKLDAWLRRRAANQLSPPPVRRPRSP